MTNEVALILLSADCVAHSVHDAVRWVDDSVNRQIYARMINDFHGLAHQKSR